ncbi:hypothetical protein PSP6_270021 [Paraburkholderia tropica]|nr:hypothetical protein PSP6_270021 [Paraburkholderia tropica]
MASPYAFTQTLAFEYACGPREAPRRIACELGYLPNFAKNLKSVQVSPREMSSAFPRVDCWIAHGEQFFSVPAASATVTADGSGQKKSGSGLCSLLKLSSHELFYGP